MILTRTGSTHESTVRMTDGRRLVELRYRRCHDDSAVVIEACDAIRGRTTINRFLLHEFHLDGTSLSDHGGVCVFGTDHIIDAVGGRMVDPVEWNVRGINVNSLRDDLRTKCSGDRVSTAFLRKLGT